MEVTLIGAAPASTDSETLALSSLSSAQARLVFACLAVEAPRAVRSDELADRLWTGPLPKSWQATLRGVIARVRRWLGDSGLDPLSAVEATNHGYRLCLPPGWSIDVHEAIAALAAAESLSKSGDDASIATTARRASDLTALEFLPDQDGDWTNETRRKLRDIHSRALEIEVDALTSAGDHREALSAIRRLVSAEPFSETARQRLMELLIAGGDRSGALAAYDEFASVLRTQLGVAPSMATQEIRARLLEDSPNEQRPRRRNFPREHLASRILVGRTAEIQRLDAAWLRARSGTASVVVIAGEAGIGKTSLAVHTARRYHDEAAPVLFGRCSLNPALPFEPVVEAIEFHLEGCSSDERDRLLATAGPELSWVVPSLIPTVPSFDLAPITDRDRRRLFDAVSKYVRCLTDARPTVLVIDDVQWATETTLLLISHVVQRLRNSPLLMVLLERRNREAKTQGALKTSLAALSRDPGLDELVLEGLGTAETEALVRLAAGVELDITSDKLLHAEQLRSRCGGNPFFMVELLRTGHDLGDPRSDGRSAARGLPRSITDVVEHHCASVGQNANSVLRALAVVGSSGEGQLVQYVSGLDDEEFLDAIDDARSTGLLMQTSQRPAHLAYSHSLAEETVYSLIPPALSARLHRRVGEGLESLRLRGVGVSTAELARHFTMAGTPGAAERAFGYTLEAALADLNVGAREDAIERLRGALIEATQPRLRCETLLLLGTAYQEQGDGLESRRCFLEVARLAGEVDEPTVLAEAALGLNVGGRGVSSWEADPVRIALLEAALAQTAAGSPALHVRLMAALSETITTTSGWTRRQLLADQAMEIAASTPSAEVAVAALDASRIAWWRPNQARTRLDYADRVLGVVDDRNHPTALRAMLMRVSDLVTLGSRAEADAALRAIWPLAQSLGQIRFIWELHLWEAGFALSDGAFDKGMARAQLAAEVWGGDDHPDAQRALREQTGMMMLLVGDASLVLAGLQRPQAIPHSAAGTYRCVVPYALVLEGRHDEASLILDDVAAHGYRDVPQHSSWLFSVAMLSEAAAVVGSMASVAQLRRMLQPHSGLMVVLEGPQVIWGCVDHHLGALAARAGDREASLHHLRAALVQHRTFGSPAWESRTLIALGALLFEGPHSEARDEGYWMLIEGTRLAETIGLLRLAASARSRARWQGSVRAMGGVKPLPEPGEPIINDADLLVNLQI